MCAACVFCRRSGWRRHAREPRPARRLHHRCLCSDDIHCRRTGELGRARLFGAAPNPRRPRGARHYKTLAARGLKNECNGRKRRYKATPHPCAVATSWVSRAGRAVLFTDSAPATRREFPRRLSVTRRRRLICRLFRGLNAMARPCLASAMQPSKAR